MTMPRKKDNYPGRVVRNHRFKNTRMHLVAHYMKGGMDFGVYSDGLDVFISELRKRIKNEQQNVVIIDGDTGAGKSTLGIQICYGLAKQLKVDFTLEKDYIYSLEDLWRKLQDPNASPINFMDEGALILSSKNSMSKESKDIVNLFNTMRSRGWSTIICVPNYKQIDKGVRTTHADFRLHCSSNDSCILKGYGRSIFEVSKAIRHEYSKDGDPYWMLIFTGIFKRMPEKIADEYKVVKNDAQRRLVDNMLKKNGEIPDDEGITKRRRGRPRKVTS